MAAWIYVGLIWCVPVFLVAGPLVGGSGAGWRLIWIALAPVTFGLGYLATCGLLARITMRSIVPGLFPRDVGHAIYGGRRLYGLCWTSVYYFTPLYNIILALPLLKRLVLRLFGYRGASDVVTYPDTWIRDLPLLDIGANVYLSNRATIATNICLKGGKILVKGVRIGRDVLVGHLAVIAPGAIIHDGAQIGVVAAIGLNSEIGTGTRIGPCCAIHHGVRIGSGVEVGGHSYVGLNAVIADGIRLPTASMIPNNAVIERQEDVARHLSSNTEATDLLRLEIAEAVAVAGGTG